MSEINAYIRSNPGGAGTPRLEPAETCGRKWRVAGDDPTRLAVAERIRAAVAALDLSPVDPGLRVTVSIGVAGGAAGDGRREDIVQRADEALYRAKATGRNRVEAATRTVA